MFYHHPVTRVSIFIDGNNMFYAQQKNGWFFDPRRVLDYFVRSQPNVELVNAFWYTGIKDPHDQRAFRDALISMGFTVRTKILKEYRDEDSRSVLPKSKSGHRNCNRYVQHRWAVR